LIGKIFKIGIIIVAVLVVWKLAGGTVDGVVSFVEMIFTRLADFLNSVATKIAEFFSGILGGSSESATP
jgi:hypothetical protein